MKKLVETKYWISKKEMVAKLGLPDGTHIEAISTRFDRELDVDGVIIYVGEKQDG